LYGRGVCNNQIVIMNRRYKKSKKNHKVYIESEITRLMEEMPSRVVRNGKCINCDEIKEYKEQIYTLRLVRDSSGKRSLATLNPMLGQRVSLEYFNTPCIYQLFLKNKIVYIGQTVNLNKRISEHVADNKIFDSYNVFKHVENIDDRLQLEAALIKLHKPKYNKTHK